MKIVSKKTLSAWYGVTGSITVYVDGTTRLKIRQFGKLQHNKIHKNKKAALAAWYRANT